MPRGGKRAGAGRRGLLPAEKRECARLLKEYVMAQFPERKDRAEQRRLRKREPSDDHETHSDEINSHFAEIRPPSKAELKQLTPEQLRDRQELRYYHARDVEKDERENEKRAEAKAKGLKLKSGRKPHSVTQSFFGRMRRGFSVPGPTKIEIGKFHQAIADEMSKRTGKSISRRQVAEACKWVAQSDPAEVWQDVFEKRG